MRQITLQQANKAVTVKDGILFMGTHKVESIQQYRPGFIAALYMVRVYDESNYPVIVTGMDLMKDGKIWLGGYPIGLWKDGNQVYIPSAHYDEFSTIERILNTLCDDTIGKHWVIFEEEDFEKYQVEYNEQEENN